MNIEEYYKKNKDRHVAYVRKIIGNHATAEDIVQEAFTRAITYIDSYKEENGKFFSWFNAIIYRILIDVLSEVVDTTDIDSLERHIYESDNGESERLLENKLALKKLICCVQNLSHRKVLEMYYIKNYTSKEIASLTDIKDPTIRQICKRFRDNVK